MKAFVYSYATRTVAFVLAVLAAMAALLSGGAMLILADGGYYDGKDASYEDLYRNAILDQSRLLIDEYESFVSRAEDPAAFWQADEFVVSRNFVCTVTDAGGETLFSDAGGVATRAEMDIDFTVTLWRGEEETAEGVCEDEEACENEIQRWVDREGEDVSVTGTSMWPTESGYAWSVQYCPIQTQKLTVHGGLRETFVVSDDLTERMKQAEWVIAFASNLLWLCPVSLLAAILLTVLLCCAAGHRRGDPEPHLTWIDKVPFDLTAVICVSVGSWMLWFAAEGVYDVIHYGEWFYGLLGVGALALASTCALWLVTTFAARITVGGWWRNNVITYLLRCAVRLMRAAARLMRRMWKKLCAAVNALPLYGKVLGGYGVLCLCEGIVLAFFRASFFSWFLCKVAVAIPVALLTVGMKKLQAGAEAIAAGCLETQVDLTGMPEPLRKHGECLNSMGAVLTQAVEERTKSERMKAELITNVSHDIKTPLTSIVNYVDLLKREPMASEKAVEYLDVLDRQSQRMKKLITDLVEASKAATGNLAAHPESVDLGLLLSQSAGEYQERLAENRLELITEVPKGVLVHADPRLLWRILDNLLNNAGKYAMPGTRVYLSARREGNCALVDVKNVSAQRLELTGEELTERFVRGDASRSTEGSGLGLSIAKSLAELQNGSFRVEVDGDLFKAIVTLPLAEA